MSKTKKRKKVKKIKEEYFSQDVCHICRKKFTKRQKRIPGTSVSVNLSDPHKINICLKCYRKEYGVFEESGVADIGRVVNSILPQTVGMAVSYGVPKEFQE